MTSHQPLLEALREWEEVSRLEGLAIERDDWPQVSACHTAKDELRQRIEALRDPASGPGWPAPVRETIAHLISLERENAERLATRRAAAESQKARLENAAMTLHRAQRSCNRPARSSWTSYG